MILNAGRVLIVFTLEMPSWNGTASLEHPHFPLPGGPFRRPRTLSRQRLVTLNNEPALVKTDALTLSVTPQIASDGSLMLNVTPILASPASSQADMLARVADGETIVLSGFSRERDVKETKAAGIKGGWFGRSTVTVRKRTELLILLTPLFSRLNKWRMRALEQKDS